MKILNHLKAKYKIDTQRRAAGSSMAGDVITVPRIAACFPVRLLQFIEMGVGRIIIDKTFLTADEIPRWLLHPAAASVLPVKTTSKLCAKLIVVTLGVCILTDDLLHRKDGKITPLTNILAYLEAARQTAAVPEEARIEFLKAVKMLKGKGPNKYEDGENMLDITVEPWVDTILSFRPDDPGHEEIREWVKRQVAVEYIQSITL